MLDYLIIYFSLSHTKSAMTAMVNSIKSFSLTLTFHQEHGHFHFNDEKLNFIFGYKI
jgi:hypothetical protein